MALIKNVILVLDKNLLKLNLMCTGKTPTNNHPIPISPNLVQSQPFTTALLSQTS